MKRREFIAGLGSTAAWPVAVWAQRRDAIKHIVWTGVEPSAEDALAFGQELAPLGWAEGRNVHVDVRREAQDIVAQDIVGAAPDLIVTVGTPATQLFKRLTETIPILFRHVAEPVASGLVASFARPGGNVTGFTNFEFSIAGKWLQILKELVPTITDVMIIYEPVNPNVQPFQSLFEAAAKTMKITVHPAPVMTAGDLVRYIETFAHDPGGGMTVLPGRLTARERGTIVSLAARSRLPAMYTVKDFVISGGLVSYSPNNADITRRLAEYADRILRGEKPANLPVQNPTRFELVINQRAAKDLGIKVPATLLAIADEVIE
jgi:putative tryptophan/tyrosine transport system substrate-binding protein